MPTNAQLAATHKVSVRTIRRWRRAGAPVGSARALSDWLKTSRVRSLQDSPAKEDLAALERGLVKDALRLTRQSAR